MRGKLWFLGGLAVGFVLGARAGRDKYEELVQTAQKIKDSPTVQEAAGVVQEQATRLYSESRSRMTDRLAHSRLADTRLGERLTGAAGAGTDEPEGTMASSGSANSAGSAAGSTS